MKARNTSSNKKKHLTPLNNNPSFTEPLRHLRGSPFLFRFSFFLLFFLFMIFFRKFKVKEQWNKNRRREEKGICLFARGPSWRSFLSRPNNWIAWSLMRCPSYCLHLMSLLIHAHTHVLALQRSQAIKKIPSSQIPSSNQATPDLPPISLRLNRMDLSARTSDTTIITVL